MITNAFPPDFGFQVCFDARGIPPKPVTEKPKDDPWDYPEQADESDVVHCCGGQGFPCCEATE